MLGIIAGIGAYLTTGQIIPGFVMNRHPVPLKVVPYIFAMALASRLYKCFRLKLYKTNNYSYNCYET